MQIILLHSRLTRVRSMTLTGKHLVALLVGLVLGVIGVGVLVAYLTLRHAAQGEGSPMMRQLLSSLMQQEDGRQEKYLKENLAVMAVKLGELEAQLMRLDSLGERVQGLSGVSPEEFNFKETPGRGGIDTSATHGTKDLSMQELQAMLSQLSVDAGHRSDYMNAVETALMSGRIKSRLLPTNMPVRAAYNSSSFGWRLDPFKGHNAFHEGLDFPAPTGTPIVAAANGVVISAQFHYQYGNVLDIDHGNDITTRYAHMSQFRVKVGDIVKRGQHIGEVGSTGRSTGPHLHFEVRVRQVAQDPKKFLALGEPNAPLKPMPVFVARGK
jgi:murein DD-endopeptidase MepM/ murein hydrolase activator NlpD